MRISKSLGATFAARPLLLVMIASVITLGWPTASSAQIAIVTDPDGVGGFKLQGNGITWWSHGECVPEFFSNGSANYKSTLFGDAHVVERDCETSRQHGQAIQAGSYMYFVRSGELIRKATALTETDPNVALDVSPHNPSQFDDQGTPLMVFEGHLYWARFNAGSSSLSILRIPTDGGPAEIVLSTTGSRPIEMAAKRYDHGSLEDVFGLVWLEQNGNLRVFRDTGSGTSIATLMTGVADFDLHSVGFFAIPGGLTRSVFVYAAVGVENPIPSGSPGRVDRIAIGDGAVTTLFTAAGLGQVLSVATDSDVLSSTLKANVYIVEALVSCSTFCSVLDRVQWRRQISGTGISSWIQYLNTDGGTDLESDDQFVYYVNNTGDVMQIINDAPPVQVDFSGLGVEVVQNTQSLLQDVPLVALKRTYARGYPGLPTNFGQKVNFSVSASLAGFRNGNPLPGSPLFSENNVSVNLGQTLELARGDLAKSFLWELPQSWTTEGSITLEMTVDPNISLPETESRANNVVATQTPAVFRPAFRSCVELRPLDVAGAPIWSPDAPNADLPSIQVRAANQLPIYGINLNFRSTPLQDQRWEVEWEVLPCFPFVCYAPITVSNYYPFVFPIDSSTDAPDGDAEALDELDYWEHTTSDPSGCTDIHWSGAVHPMTSWNAAGLGRVGGLSLIFMPFTDPAIAPADFNHALGGRILAHEIGHNHGRRHIDCGDPGGTKDNPPFDECEFSSSDLTLPSTHFGFDVLTEQPLDPTESGDLMSYADTRWISAWNYQNILNDLLAGGSAAFAGPSAAAAAATGPQLLIRGHVDALAPSAEFGMAYLFQEGDYDLGKADQSADAAFAAESTNDWRLVVRDDIGSELLRTGVILRLDADGDESYFSQYLPFPTGAEKVELLLNDAFVAELVPSNNAPSLTLYPPVYDAVGGTLSLQWTASDADGDPLHFSLWYSTDGLSWETLRMNYPGLSATFSTAFLPGSSAARIKLAATDGFNSAVAESSPFAVDDHDPMVLIAGLRDNEHVAFGKRVELFGAGLDAEDGSVPEEMLDWVVSGAESIAATGDALSLPRLLPGPYLVELTGTDASARSSTGALPFVVDPLLVPETALPTLDGTCGDPAYVGATFVEIPLTSGGYTQARLAHAGDDLYVCFSDAERGPLLFSAPVSVGVRVEGDGEGDALPETGDHAFLVNDQGLAYQLVPSGGPGNLFALTAAPWPGVNVAIDLNPGGWSAEFQIGDEAVGGWDHAARIQLNHIRSGSTPVGDSWPAGGDEHSPATWAPAYFGTFPSPANRAPVAEAGPDHVLDPLSLTEVVLNGTGSFDHDGDALTYQWTQTGGPAIPLLNDTTAAASLIVGSEIGATTYIFDLVVNDGTTNSPPDQVTIKVMPSLPAPVTSFRGPMLLPFVHVGDPGNAPHPDFFVGGVSYVFDAGTTEVSNGAYVLFLNSVAATDPAGLFSAQMESDPRGGILRSGNSGSYSYTTKPNMDTKPVNFVSWRDAARYVNWLENGAPVAPVGPGVTEDGSYNLASSPAPQRVSGATYVLPNEHEWVKAGHFLGGASPAYSTYATQADIDPAYAGASPTGNTLNPSSTTANYQNGAHWNGLTGHFVSVASTQAASFYGTYDQGGNVEEWTESLGSGGAGVPRIVRGGSFRDSAFDLSLESRVPTPTATERDDLGFRVFKVAGPPPPDADADSVPDTSDNCVSVENGPAAGTCVWGATAAIGTVCYSSPQCGGGWGFCSLHQEDTDGNGIGLACDPTEVPEPGFLLSLLVGAGGVAGWARRKKQLDAVKSSRDSFGKYELEADSNIRWRLQS